MNNKIFESQCLMAHVRAIKVAKLSYLAQLNFLLESNTFSFVTSGVRTSILVALHTTSQHKALGKVMLHCDVVEIAKAATILDRGRLSRQLQRKIQDIENQHPHLIVSTESDDEDTQDDTAKKPKSRSKIDVYRRKLRAIESELAKLTEQSCNHSLGDCAEAHQDTSIQEIIQSAPGVSGAFARKVRNWAKTTLTSDFLEFVMLGLPKNSIWKNLADLVHFSPSDFAVPYFLADVHSDSIPDSSFVAKMRVLVDSYVSAGSFQRIASEFPQVYLAYPFLRQHPDTLLQDKSVVVDLAKHVPLDVVIWYFEEFYQRSKKCEAIVRERLQKEGLATKSKTRTYGKLVERILTFRRMSLKLLAGELIYIADERLKELESYWKEMMDGKKVAVLGDASASMQRAVEAATIFASLVSVSFDADLTFFQDIAIAVDKPRNVKEVLSVCNKIRADRCTSLAAALWQYMDQHIDVFVLVTDEYENTNFNNLDFAQSLVKYKKEVNENVKLVVVTVGGGYSGFRASLSDNDIKYKQITIDEGRPDLAKFDTLLGQLVQVDDEQTSEDETMSVDDSAAAVQEAPGSDFVIV
jgi:hypothetical protein